MTRSKRARSPVDDTVLLALWNAIEDRDERAAQLRLLWRLVPRGARAAVLRAHPLARRFAPIVATGAWAGRGTVGDAFFEDDGRPCPACRVGAPCVGCRPTKGKPAAIVTTSAPTLDQTTAQMIEAAVAKAVAKAMHKAKR